MNIRDDFPVLRHGAATVRTYREVGDKLLCLSGREFFQHVKLNQLVRLVALHLCGPSGGFPCSIRCRDVLGTGIGPRSVHSTDELRVSGFLILPDGLVIAGMVSLAKSPEASLGPLLGCLFGNAHRGPNFFE